MARSKAKTFEPGAGLYATLVADGAGKALKKENAKTELTGLYRFFCEQYQMEYSINYHSSSKVGDMAALKTVYDSYGLEMSRLIVAKFIKDYDRRFKTDKYRIPKIIALKFAANDLAYDIKGGKKPVKQLSKEEEIDLEWF